MLVALAIQGKLPLWSLLVGVAGVAGAYELTFAAAPTEVLSSSLSAVTSLLVAAGVGFLACSLAPAGPRDTHRADGRGDVQDDHDHDYQVTMENNA